METMIPPQVGMRLWTKQKKERKKRGHKKRKKKMRKKERRDNATISFSTLVLQSSTMIFMIESLLCCHFHILMRILHYRTWLVYSNDGLPQNSHHTYLLLHFHSHSEIYCHATFHRSVYHDTFIIVILFSMIMQLTQYLWQSHHS